MSQRISAVFGSKVTESMSTFRDIRLTLAFDTGIFVQCDVSFRRYAVSSA